MTRRGRLIVELALVGVLALLVFPGAGSALRPMLTISLSSSGPSPAVFTTPVGLGSIWFHNTDTVTHSIAFADGWCSGQVAPDGRLYCGFLPHVGDYAYTFDGSIQAHVVAKAVGRSVSLRARSHSIRLGSQLTLRGRLQEANSNWSPPSAGQPQRIIVIARPYLGHPFHRVAVVTATVHPRTKRAPFGELRWHVRIRPHWDMTYVAVASYQPAAGTVWQRATSKPFRIIVRRPR
jgi:hypothetical protein